MYTISTTSSQTKGVYATSPPASAFVLPYRDSFETYPVATLAKYFSDMQGDFEIFQNGGTKTLRQSASGPPYGWCSASQYPVTLIGEKSFSNYSIHVDVLVESSNGFAVVGGRTTSCCCSNIPSSSGYYFEIHVGGMWRFLSATKVLQSGNVASFRTNTWYTVELQMRGTRISGLLNNVTLFSVDDSTFHNGWGILGCDWGYVQFDNFAMLAQ